MASVSKTTKGKMLVMCNGYEMRKKYASQLMQTQTWHCLRKYCNGIATSVLGSQVGLIETQQHTCRKSLSSIEKRQGIEQMKADAVKSLGTRLNDVFIIGKGNATLVSIQVESCVKMSIAEERDKRLAQEQKGLRIRR